MANVSRRTMLGGAVAITAPFISRPVRAESRAYPPREYPKKVVDIVNEALVLDMLHVIRLDGVPVPMTEQLASDYRTSGINGILHGIGIHGPDARDQVFQYYTVWGHYIAVNSHVFTGVDKMADIVRAKRQGKVAVIMGMQDSDHFNKVDDVAFFYKLGQRVSAGHLQQPEPARRRLDRAGRRRPHRLWRGDRRGDEQGRHARRRLALRATARRSIRSRLGQADRDHPQQLPRARQSSAAQDRRGDPGLRCQGRRDGD
jgi:hypothetical protein